MSDAGFGWITFHRVRFPAPVALAAAHFDAPKQAVHWLFGPDSSIGPDGFYTLASEVWGGAAFYRDREAAEEAMDDARGTFPFFDDTVETWSALLCPIGHRGETRWFGAPEGAHGFQMAEHDPAPDGTLAVLTSAGFNRPQPGGEREWMVRTKDFIANVDRVRTWYATLPGNLAQGNFQPARPDGMTFSAWRDDEAMRRAAYQPGVHRAQIDRYKTERTADRTSFTRARILRSTGTWDGRLIA